MRTTRLFLGIFALALLLPLLLLACGGSDEPTDGPSSERSTAEPTDLPDSERATDEPDGRTSSGQTTAAPTAEGAEPPPTPSVTAGPTPAGIATPTRPRVIPMSTPRSTDGPPMAQTSPETDREALVALYNATGGPHWKINNNWLSDVPISEWIGVTTDDNGRVIELDLRVNQLSGEIPAELGSLTNLQFLRLQGNQLTGEIPAELGSLTNLRWLNLNNNQLTGEIPAELGDLTNLEVLDLRTNRLTGEILAELGSLTNLQFLRLQGNQLTGCIPAGLRDVPDNDFSSLGLPFCMPSASAGDAASDRAPLVALYNATGGRNWRNNGNWLSNAPIGAWHGVTTDSDGRVTHLDLYRNQLTGEIPAELGNLTNLEGLWLFNNQLTGEIRRRSWAI